MPQRILDSPKMTTIFFLVQGLEYKMKVAQPTKHFLQNEFIFGLRASQILQTTTGFMNYFIIVSEGRCIMFVFLE